MVTTAPDQSPGDPGSPGEAPLPLPPLLWHKIAPPALDARTLLRPHLLRALDAAAAQRLTALIAPAGYGKTTLLATWAIGQHPPAPQAAPERLAWLTLGREENEPRLFATMLAAALQRAGLAQSPPPYQLCESDEQVRLTIAWALNAIAAGPAPVALVLDGYELLSSPAANELVSFLLEHGPPGLRLILASRGEPPLPLARLRARRQLAELRSDDLRWSTAEAALYLNDRLALALDQARIAALVARAEGWATGLSLAALAIEEGHGQADEVAQRFVADFLLGEVLAHEPPELQRFLLDAALLDELSAPLVEALLPAERGVGEARAAFGGYPSGQAALEAVERRGLFLQPVAGRSGVYRFHGLFATSLRTQLRMLYPARADELAERIAAARGAPARQPRPAPSRAGGLAESLSEREQEILDLIAAGLPNREVATSLKISESTVKSHLKHIFAKLNARNRTEAVAIAREHQLLKQ